MKPIFQILATATFERRYRKLHARDPGLALAFASALALLERDPRRGRPVKKLVGVGEGEGAWRIRIGIYRIRYDIVDRESSVVLHTIGLRKDIYKRK